MIIVGIIAIIARVTAAMLAGKKVVERQQVEVVGVRGLVGASSGQAVDVPVSQLVGLVRLPPTALVTHVVMGRLSMKTSDTRGACAQKRVHAVGADRGDGDCDDPGNDRRAASRQVCRAGSASVCRDDAGTGPSRHAGQCCV